MAKSLVILSGGQDSAICAAIASQLFDEVHAVTFNYGQRHAIEIESAIAVARKLNLSSHEIIDMGAILKGTSPLISDNKLGQYDGPQDLPGGVEPTFVPMRNLLFLTIAANRAVVHGIQDMFTGVCEADFGGYPDCRATFVKSAEQTIREGIDSALRFTIHAPLMHVTKAESVLIGQRVLGARFDEVMELTHTCYAGIKGGCGKCHACIIRDRGFTEAGVDDPIWKFREANVNAA